MIIRYLVGLVGKARHFRESALIFVLDAYVLFMATILIYSFFVKRTMSFEFLGMASIILIPLGILIISLDIDLHSDESTLDQEIFKLSGVSSSAKREILRKKVKVFEISSIIAYILVTATLCILPFLSLIGFNWGWK